MEEVPHMRKCQLATHLAGMPILPMVKVTTEEKVLSMYRQQYEIEEPSRAQEEYDLEVHRESAEKKIQSTINSVGEQSALLLMAVGDCVINKKSKGMVYQEVGCNEPCLERRSTRKEVNNTNKKEKEKHQKKAL